MLPESAEALLKEPGLKIVKDQSIYISLKTALGAGCRNLFARSRNKSVAPLGKRQTNWQQYVTFPRAENLRRRLRRSAQAPLPGGALRSGFAQRSARIRCRHFAVPMPHRFGRNSGNGDMLRDIPQYHAAGGDLCPVADANIARLPGCGTNRHLAACLAAR